MQGVARIRCTNPDCGHDYFRPFYCKGFYLCPSCSQKRTLLFAEHLNEEVLLRLPHRQFVFTFPEALRVFFRHDRKLFAEISKMIFAMISDFYRQVAGKKIDTGMVIAHQTFGDMLRWNPCSFSILKLLRSFPKGKLHHFHAILLEGGFDEDGSFVYLPLSGFSIDNSVRILDERSRENLA